MDKDMQILDSGWSETALAGLTTLVAFVNMAGAAAQFLVYPSPQSGVTVAANAVLVGQGVRDVFNGARILRAHSADPQDQFELGKIFARSQSRLSVTCGLVCFNEIACVDPTGVAPFISKAPAPDLAVVVPSFLACTSAAGISAAAYEINRARAKLKGISPE